MIESGMINSSKIFNRHTDQVQLDNKQTRRYLIITLFSCLLAKKKRTQVGDPWENFLQKCCEHKFLVVFKIQCVDVFIRIYLFIYFCY